MSADIDVGRQSIDTRRLILVDSRSTLDRQSVDSRSTVDRVSIEYRSSVDRLSTATSTDIAVDIAVDITYSKHVNEEALNFIQTPS